MEPWEEDDEFVLQIAYSFQRMLCCAATREALLQSTQAGSVNTHNTSLSSTAVSPQSLCVMKWDNFRGFCQLGKRLEVKLR